MTIYDTLTRGKMTKLQYDYFIIGQGIAGTMLSYFLLRKNKRVLVFDDARGTAASLNALGLCNPIRGRNLKLASEYPEAFPFARKTYKTLEKLIEYRFCFDLEQIRLFVDKKQRRNWERKRDDAVFSQYVKGEIAPDSLDKIACEFGGLRISETFYVDIEGMLPKYRFWLNNDDAIFDGAFHYDRMRITNDGVIYEDKQTKNVVFCEGHRVSENPFFKQLPHEPSKGEWLIVKFKNFDPGVVINRSLLIIPIGEGKYKVGATFDTSDLTNKPTENAKNELVRRLKTVIEAPFEIIRHAVGIRPKTRDNQPLLERHPQHPNLAIFSGWGSIGFILTPFYARQFADFLEKTNSSEQLN